MHCRKQKASVWKWLPAQSEEWRVLLRQVFMHRSPRRDGMMSNLTRTASELHLFSPRSRMNHPDLYGCVTWQQLSRCSQITEDTSQDEPVIKSTACCVWQVRGPHVNTLNGKSFILQTLISYNRMIRFYSPLLSRVQSLKHLSLSPKVNTESSRLEILLEPTA